MDVIEENRINNINQEETEIRLVDITQFIKHNYRKILIGGLVGFVISMLYIIPKPNIYTVEVTIMPEIQSKVPSGLSSLSSFAGVSTDNNGTLDSRPDLYPNVLGSVPFAMEMLKKKVYSKKLEAIMTLEEFINKTSTSSFIDKIQALFSSDDGSDSKVGKVDPRNISQAILVTKGQYGLIKSVQSSVSSAYDKRTGIITITVNEIDPVVAATVANLSLKYLTDYIIAYRTDKARKRVIFLTNQVGEAKRRYESAQYALSNFRDRNISLYLNTAKIDEQRLQADYLLEQSVYNELSRQLEQAKIKVDEDTPTLKILSPPVIPIYKSGPKRTLIILSCAAIGAIVTCVILFIRSRKFS